MFGPGLMHKTNMTLIKTTNVVLDMMFIVKKSKNDFT